MNSRMRFGPPKHTLVVPRAGSRLEQRIRAERMQDLGLLHMLPNEDLSPAAIAAWLARDLGPAPRARERIDLSGLGRLPHMLADLLDTPRRAYPAARTFWRIAGSWRAAVS